MHKPPNNQQPVTVTPRHSDLFYEGADSVPTSITTAVYRRNEENKKSHGRIFSGLRYSHLLFMFAVLILVTVIDTGCRSKVPAGKRGETVMMTVTAYCPCQKCCGWTRDWLGRPVFASGPLKGQRKQVGICADGSRAAKGTVAADTRYYPFGTQLFIPGYGHGTVHDRGSAIQGPAHIDIFFKSHKKALEWGRQHLPVRVYR